MKRVKRARRLEDAGVLGRRLRRPGAHAGDEVDRPVLGRVPVASWAARVRSPRRTLPAPAELSQRPQTYRVAPASARAYCRPLPRAAGTMARPRGRASVTR